MTGTQQLGASESGLPANRRNDFIEFLVASGALQFGDFTTKSGRKTPYFVNTARFDDGEKISRLGAWYAEAIANVGYDVQTVFGPAYKGIPLSVSTSIALSQRLNRPVGYTFNRKEEKKHGDGGVMVGTPLTTGIRAVLVEDVITAGTTMREILPVLSSLGVTVQGVFVAVDRMERGANQAESAQKLSAVAEVRQEYKINVHPLITLIDLIEYVKISRFASFLPAIMNYREQYGV